VAPVPVVLLKVPGNEIWSRWEDRVFGLAFGAGLLLLAGLVWLAVVLVTQGVDRANAWGGVLGPSLTITIALVALVKWRLKQRAAATEPARADQVAWAAQELQAVVREQWRRRRRSGRWGIRIRCRCAGDCRIRR
jgi:hypothetical protein